MPAFWKSSSTDAVARFVLSKIAVIGTWGLLVSVGGPEPAVAQPVDFDIVYVRQARFGDTTNTIWPEVFHPARLDPGADLVLLRPDGSEEILVDETEGGITDPCISFDGESVYYSRFPDLRQQSLNYQRSDLPYAGADIFRMHVPTREITQLTFGEFTPNTGAGIWDESNPVNPPSQFHRLGYGILNLGACPLPDGRVAFTSNRNGFWPVKSFTAPALQIFVMDEDGDNVELVTPMTINSALHPTPLRDGRMIFSTYESQGLRDRRLWGIWSIYPDGRQWEPVVSAFNGPQAFHFMTQLSDESLVIVDYYNLNNNGFGALYRMPVRPPEGEPPFHSAFPADNPSIDQTVEGGFSYPFKMPFTPRGLHSITPFTHGGDQAAPVGGDGSTRVGKFTHPSAAPDNDLLVVWTPGPANDLNRPTPDPRYDAGLYLVVGGATVTDPDQLVLIRNDPAYNEAWPRALVPYAAIHGVEEPVAIPYLPNDGTLDPRLPAGTPHGLVGTSSFYKRETFPGRSNGGSFDGLDVFNTSENGQSSNFGTQGSDVGLYDDSDIWAVRIVALEPSTHRSYGPDYGQRFFQHGNERHRILGEIPLRKWDDEGAVVLDSEGNPDTSFLAKVPADTPFTFQTLDRNGAVLNMAQTWHQLRPGEVRTDCGGCHAHSQQPLAFEGTAAAAADYPVFDLGAVTPMLRWAAAARGSAADPTVEVVDAGVVDVEFFQDIRPLLQGRCVSCHTQTAASPPGDLVLDDLTSYGGLPGDYKRLAADSAADWGHPPVISNGIWRQTNASRYLRRYQSRRSMLVWKLFGERMDGWTNADHPTETVPGDAGTLPAAAERNDADLDYFDTLDPAHHTLLSGDEKMTFARWIDLGAPIDFGTQTWNGWFLDDLRPTLTVSSPRGDSDPVDVTSIRVGMADANTGLALGTFSVRADFPVSGRAPHSELADLFQDLGDGIRELVLAEPLPQRTELKLWVAVEDQQGNITRVERTFGSADLIFADDFEFGSIAAWSP